MQQRWTYGTAVAGLGTELIRIEVQAQGRTIALAQALRRRCVVPVTLITRGPVWLGNPDESERARVFRELRACVTGPVLLTLPSLSDCPSAAEAGLWHLMTPTSVAMLSPGPEFRERMHGKWRNRLCSAEKAGLNVRTTSRSVADMNWLFTADAAQQRSRRYRALPAAFTEAWLTIDPESVFMLTAHLGKAPIAAMLFLKHGNTATYHIGWTSDAGRKASAGNLILTHAAEKLADLGVRNIDLGLLDTENTPGLARFKLGTGATPLQTGGTWLGW